MEQEGRKSPFCIIAIAFTSYQSENPVAVLAEETEQGRGT
jgi:hypothetical protein